MLTTIRLITFSKARLLLVLLVSILPVQGQTSYIPVSTVGFSGTREVPLNIKLVFLGLTSSEINSTYLQAKVNIPSAKPQTILAGAQGTGVTYHFNYQVSFADNATVESLVSLLKSIEINRTTTPGVDTFRNPYFDNSTTMISNVTNSFYDAMAVENWFNSSLAFGASPVPGYTLFIADLHDYLPSLTYLQYQNYTMKCSTNSTGQCQDPRGTARAHYYNTTVVEPDLGLMQKRHFMTAWGGSSRSYYVDISAGPSYWTEELPIQVAFQLRSVDSAPSYQIFWRTQFIADHVLEVVYNLFAPDLVYPANYSSNYNFHVFVFDVRNSTEKADVSLASTVNQTLIQDELRRIASYANVTVTTRFANVSDHPGLETIVSRATSNTTDPLVDGKIVDARIVYDWLSTYGEGHVSQFINMTQNTEELDIAAFVFAFAGPYNFGFTFKDDVFLSPEMSSIYGVALGDLVLISHGHYDLIAGDIPAWSGQDQPGKGVGFSRTIIHEFGHMLGLAHPFSYGLTEDFSDSVMGYYVNSLTFSQFDKDTYLRGVNDQLLIFAKATLANTTSNIFNAAQIGAANQAISRADQKYSRMEYDTAVPDSFEAALNAFTANQIAWGPLALFSPGLVFGLIGTAAGVGLGLLLGFLVFRRKRPTSGVQYYKCPTCGQPLRWDPAITRWYCDRCQRPI